MLSRQLNIAYGQLNLLEIKCEAKWTNNLSQFYGKFMNRGIIHPRSIMKSELSITCNYFLISLFLVLSCYTYNSHIALGSKDLLIN